MHRTFSNTGFTTRVLALFGALASLDAGTILNTSALDSDAASIIEPGAKVKLLSDDFQFTEGPAADAEGNVFFTDQPNDRIMMWSIDGNLTTFMQPAGRSNGLYFDRQGNLLACADEKNQLWSISPEKQVSVLIENYKGKLLNGPNDLWIRPDGGIYFTDPFYRRGYWDRDGKQLEAEQVFYMPPDRGTFTPVATDLRQPNGIIGTPDGKKLYVADIRGRKTYAYAVQPSGRLAEKTLFTEMGSDGMTIDSEGNIYLTGRGVTVFNAHGKQIDHIEIPERWTANVCFGGNDRKSLFITASDSLYSIRTRVRGVQ